jgi:hypothetical protein
MTMTYDVLTAATAQELAQAVNKSIHEGWQPLGGVSFVLIEYESVTYRTEKYAQAIVKAAKQEKPK